MSSYEELLEQHKNVVEKNRELTEENEKLMEEIIKMNIDKYREIIEMEEFVGRPSERSFPSTFGKLEMGDEYIILLWSVEMKKDSEGKVVMACDDDMNEEVVWKNVFYKAIHRVMKPHLKPIDERFIAGWVKYGSMAAVIKKNN